MIVVLHYNNGCGMKHKGTNVVKVYDGERYVFKNSVAVVPGMCMYKKHVRITLKEYNSLVRYLNEQE